MTESNAEQLARVLWGYHPTYLINSMVDYLNYPYANWATLPEGTKNCWIKYAGVLLNAPEIREYFK